MANKKKQKREKQSEVDRAKGFTPPPDSPPSISGSDEDCQILPVSMLTPETSPESTPHTTPDLIHDLGSIADSPQSLTVSEDSCEAPPIILAGPSRAIVMPSGPVTHSGPVCLWESCGVGRYSPGDLQEHVETAHINSQGPRFHCCWQNCKFSGQSSNSRSWLQRHVRTHSGAKPYRCIIEGCGREFGTHLMLERHVRGHLDMGTMTQTSPHKQKKRRARRRRLRPVRTSEFMDNYTVQQLSNLLEQPLPTTVIARRVSPDGTVSWLLEWEGESHWLPMQHISMAYLRRVMRFRSDRRK